MPTKDVLDAAAEPMAWFQHDANAAQDSKCQRLLLRLGNAGYGAYWRLCEYLAAEKGHSAAIETDEDWLILAMRLGFNFANEDQSIAECQDFIANLLEIGLVVRDGKGRIESARMQRNALFFGTQRAIGRANGHKGGRPRKSKAEQQNSR